MKSHEGSLGDGGPKSQQRPYPVYYVYHLVSEPDPKRRYTGFTEDLKQRVIDHNRGCNPSTAGFTPWKQKGYLAFDTKPAALAFERYLKSGSGHAFAKKRLW